MHDNMTKFYCPKCNKEFSLQYAINYPNVVPRCDECKSDIIIRPDIVMYEESMKSSVANAAYKEIFKSQLIIVIGSTLEVSTIFNMIQMAPPEKLIIINKGKTAFDSIATLKLEEDIVEALTTINNLTELREVKNDGENCKL